MFCPLLGLLCELGVPVEGWLVVVGAFVVVEVVFVYSVLGWVACGECVKEYEDGGVCECFWFGHIFIQSGRYMNVVVLLVVIWKNFVGWARSFCGSGCLCGLVGLVVIILCSKVLVFPRLMWCG